MKQTFSLRRLACHLYLHVADSWIEEICAPWRSWWSCARASIFSFQFFTQAKPHLPRDSGGRERALKHVTFSHHWRHKAPNVVGCSAEDDLSHRDRAIGDSLDSA